ncbi:MAG TPA: hypothetical protein VES62_10020 [Thermoleophilaceae bacterium]|nr:hypothetical protein [Thermoleophilaceae bacterium]
MAALCRSYATHGEALEAVNAVLGAAVPGEDVLVLMAERARDAHQKEVGEFAGATEPGAPVGEFAGAPQPQGSSTGDFAGGEHRGGSFGDTERDVFISYPEGVERMRVTGHRRITRLLVDAGLDHETAKSDVDALHRGLVLVVVEVTEGDVAQVAGHLEG